MPLERFGIADAAVPLSELPQTLEAIRAELQNEREHEVVVTALGPEATVVARAGAPDADAARVLEQELRVRVHDRLRAEGVFAS